MEYAVGLIGLGAIGTPIAHKLYKWDSKRFTLIADPIRKKKLQSQKIKINGEAFSPHIISKNDELDLQLDLVIICVKNFHLNSAINDIKNVITSQTVLLPLENGISAYYTLREAFPKNVILEGYAQGPNTERVDDGFVYSNSGSVHMGSSRTELCDKAIDSYLLLKQADVPVIYEAEIRRMVWKKWMLNTAGNYVTAILDANYSDFKHSIALQDICRDLMREFVLIANAKHIYLDESDIESVIQYFVNYKGEKSTSMLDDVLNKRMTENEYIAGEAIRVAESLNISVPSIEIVYKLVKAKESLYLHTL